MWGHECLDVSPHGRFLEISCEQREAPLILRTSRGPGYRPGWESGLEELGLLVLPLPHPIRLTSAGRQAAGLDGVRLVPLTLSETVGIGPAHNLPLLDTLSTGGRTLPQDRQGQATVIREGQMERQREGAVSSNPANAQDRKGTKKDAKSPLDQWDEQNCLIRTARQLSNIPVLGIFEPQEPFHHLNS